MDLNYLIPRRFVGLCVSYDSVEVTVVRRDWRQTSIEKVVKKKIAIQDVDVNDQNEILRNAIEDIFIEHKIPRTGISLTLPTHDVVLRTFQMPRLPQEDWAQAIRYEGQKYIPFRLEEISADYCVLPATERAEHMDILFACAKSLVVSRYNAILAAAGVTAVQLGSVFLAMFKAATYVKAIDPQVPTLLISAKKKFFGRERIRCMADIVLVHNDVPLLARDISVVSTEEDVDDKFFNEIFLSVKLFQSSVGQLHIQKAVFLDGGSLYKWDQFFEEHFNAEVEAINFADVLGGEPTDGVSLGIALSELVFPAIDVNLFQDKSSLDMALAPFPLRKVATFCIAASLAVISCFSIFYFLKSKNIDRNANKLKKSLGSLSSVNENQLKKRKKEAMALEQALKPYQRPKVPHYVMIQTVSDIVAEESDVWIETWTYLEKDKGQKILEFTGKSYKQDSVQDVLAVNKIKAKIKEYKDLAKFFPHIDVGDTSQRRDKTVGKDYTHFVLKMETVVKKKRKS